MILELLDVFAKAVVEAFQVARGDDKSLTTASLQSKKGTKSQLVRFELDTGDHTWYIAPLIAKLDFSVQQRVLRQATQLMENCTWSTKPKEREKMIKRYKLPISIAHKYLKTFLEVRQPQTMKRHPYSTLLPSTLLFKQLICLF
jgi:hypothetical protein